MCETRTLRWNIMMIIRERLQDATAGTGQGEKGRACGRSLPVGRRAWAKLTD